ncbi:MAG: hypothetical protein ACTS1Z_08655 [Parasphingopyxis sp.]|uniref:hypothetical protein n=1 Tax=Parasphingopyxis sp. TaxID=1920299 RepID=UPI003FA01205
MRFARWTFGIAAVWGIAIIAPLYFLESRIAADFPPPVARPELYYGFVGVVLAWQFVYALIAIDPVRYRPIMLIGALGKLSFFGACTMLYLQGRVEAALVTTTAPDLLLALLFCLAWVKTGGMARRG